MPAARTDPEQRSAAIAAYREFGLAEAHRVSGIPKSTLRDWARAEGLDTAAIAGQTVEQVAAALEAREARIAEMRSELREQLIGSALDMTERLKDPHIDYRGKDMTEVKFDQAPADACRNYAVAAAVFIDKFRLESGESTSRTEIERGDLSQQAKRVAGMRDELRARREQTG